MVSFYFINAVAAASLPTPLPSLACLGSPNPFDTVSFEFVRDKLQRDSAPSGYKPLELTDRIVTYHASVSTAPPETTTDSATTTDPSSVLASFFADTDLVIVPDSQLSLKLNEIHHSEAILCYEIMQSFKDESEYIHFFCSPEFKDKVIRQFLILMSRPASRSILIAIHKSKAHICIEKGPRNEISYNPSIPLFTMNLNFERPEYTFTRRAEECCIEEFPPYIILAHELIHALHYETKEDLAGKLLFLGPAHPRFTNLEEQFTIAGIPGSNFVCENMVRAEFGLSERVTHASSSFPPFSSLYKDTVDTDCIDGMTRLEQAVRHGAFSEVKKLIAWGANPQSALFDALASRQFEIFDYLLDNLRAPVDTQTLLVYAARNRLDKGLTSLLSRFPYSYQALYQLIDDENVESLDFLLAHGANVHSEDAEGTPLIIKAVQMNVGPKILSCLIRHGASVNATTFDGEPALHHAIRRGKFTSVETLVKHGANIETPYQGLSPLLVAATVCKHTEFHYLVRRGAKLDGPTLKGFSKMRKKINKLKNHKIKKIAKREFLHMHFIIQDRLLKKSMERL